MENKEIKPFVMIAQPKRVGSIPVQNLAAYPATDIDLWGYSYGYTSIESNDVANNRNWLIDQVIDTGAKYLLFVDDDVALPYKAFKELHSTAKDNPDAMIVGVYYFKGSDPMIQVVEDDYIVPADVTPGKTFEAVSTGLGCALIPISILKKMRDTEPGIPYCWVTNKEGEPFQGEDEWFTHRLRNKYGFKIICNTNVQCLHIYKPTGEFTAHPSVKLEDYRTTKPVTKPLESRPPQHVGI
jgi:hypothetical protein